MYYPDIILTIALVSILIMFAVVTTIALIMLILDVMDHKQNAQNVHTSNAVVRGRMRHPHTHPSISRERR